MSSLSLKGISSFICRYYFFQDFQYHAFIIYNHEDRHWMKKQLLPLLEEKHHLTCCIHYKDFIPGKPIRDNMADSVYTSYKVIALFSNNFVKSNCCMYELDVAVNRLVQRRDNSLAIIRIDGADWKHLPAEVRDRCSIDYHYPQERPFWRKRLLKFLNLPEECRIQSTSKEPATGINNDENDSENLRVELNRLQSTESNASEISFLSLQPNLHQETTWCQVSQALLLVKNASSRIYAFKCETPGVVVSGTMRSLSNHDKNDSKNTTNLRIWQNNEKR